MKRTAVGIIAICLLLLVGCDIDLSQLELDPETEAELEWLLEASDDIQQQCPQELQDQISDDMEQCMQCENYTSATCEAQGESVGGDELSQEFGSMFACMIECFAKRAAECKYIVDAALEECGAAPVEVTATPTSVDVPPEDETLEEEQVPEDEIESNTDSAPSEMINDEELDALLEEYLGTMIAECIVYDILGIEDENCDALDALLSEDNNLQKPEDTTFALTDIRGDVWMSQPGSDELVPMTANTIVQQGTQIMTGPDSSTFMTFPDGSTVYLSENTFITIDETFIGDDAARTIMYLQAGAVRGHVRHTPAIRADFSVRTPTYTASVRGTKFWVRADEEGYFSVDTLDGTVAVYHGEQLETTVAAGYGVETQDGTLAQNQHGIIIPDEPLPAPLPSVPAPVQDEPSVGTDFPTSAETGTQSGRLNYFIGILTIAVVGTGIYFSRKKRGK